LYGERTPQPPEPLVHRVVENNALRHPDRPAIVGGEVVWTYAELDRRAEALATHLRWAGIGRGSVVGLFLARSPHLVCSILAVLKAGAAYVPLDTTYPQGRIATMLSELDALELVLFSEDTRDDLPPTAVPTWRVTDPGLGVGVDGPVAHPDTRGDDLCYVVFTSGSTGTPKAVGIRHSGWFNLLDWLRIEYSLDDRSSGVIVSSFGFDITQRAIMAPLFTGATLHLVPGRYFDLTLSYRCIVTTLCRRCTAPRAPCISSWIVKSPSSSPPCARWHLSSLGENPSPSVAHERGGSCRITGASCSTSTAWPNAPM
jgi:D-alanine--poly(phosphoribitol) ligase subunit 1